MALALPDDWIWDFWLARDGADIHLFHLSAPRSLGDPEERHLHARIGHAVSQDLRTWKHLGPALPDAPDGASDDLASWTGCVVRAGQEWHMLYTGISQRDRRSVQRIVSAVSPDLITWQRTPLSLEADPDRYDVSAWRDPWVLWDSASQVWRMYVTTKVKEGDDASRGAIATMTSYDLLQWEPGPLVAGPGEFRQMEVPQIVPCGEGYALLFCANDRDHSPSRVARGVNPEFGTHAFYGDSLEGPFAQPHDAFLSGDDGPPLYGGRAIQHERRWWFLAWQRLDDTGGFGGSLSDPFPMDVVDGRLVIDFGDEGR